jgi:hypothetical protein
MLSGWQLSRISSWPQLTHDGDWLATVTFSTDLPSCLVRACYIASGRINIKHRFQQPLLLLGKPVVTCCLPAVTPQRTISSDSIILVVRYHVTILYSIEWWDDWWMKDWKGLRKNRPWLNRGTIPKFSWRGWREERKTSVGIVGVPAEIQTEDLPYTSPERYHYAITVGVLMNISQGSTCAPSGEDLTRWYNDKCRVC